MSSLEKVSPGISPRFFSQKMDAKLPEKNMPLHRGERNQALRKGAVLDPSQRPLGLIGHGRHCFYGVLGGCRL